MLHRTRAVGQTGPLEGGCDEGSFHKSAAPIDYALVSVDAAFRSIESKRQRFPSQEAQHDRNNILHGASQRGYQSIWTGPRSEEHRESARRTLSGEQLQCELESAGNGYDDCGCVAKRVTLCVRPDQFGLTAGALPGRSGADDSAGSVANRLGGCGESPYGGWNVCDGPGGVSYRAGQSGQPSGNHPGVSDQRSLGYGVDR